MKITPFRIVLVEPQIPQNTGNIARLCACTGSELYLIGKLGFVITDKHLKRAGLDYWEDVNIKHLSTLEELQEQYTDNSFYYISTKAKRYYSDQKLNPGDFLVFGSETKGLPKDLIESNPDRSLRIPMKEEQRSLNLSNSVAVVLYDALRQNDFINLI